LSPLLETVGLTRRFGGVVAVDDLDLRVEQGEILGLIGPNGAGKSTAFSMISGFLRPTGGRITFDGRDITRARAYEIARLGIGRVFQHSVSFRRMSALDNVLVGFHQHHQTGLLGSLLRTGKARREEAALRQEALDLLDFMGLSAVKDETPLSLPHGHQRGLSVALALAARPKLLLLDEPVTGMNPSESALMTEHIRKIRDGGVTIVIVEHDMKVVMDLCDRLVVLDYGAKICEGPPERVCVDPLVCEAYLGKGTFDAA
jgi:branched-chain amino acid transport system ATP-binding protein